MANLVVKDLHLHGVAGEVEVHDVLLQANGDCIVGRQRERQVIEYCLANAQRRLRSSIGQTHHSDHGATAMAYDLDQHLVLQAASRRPVSRRSRGGPLPRFLGLSRCARNRHRADRCKNTGVETDFHSSSP
jgi:hypothetical protein